MAIDPIAPQTLYAGSMGAGVYKSTRWGAATDVPISSLTGVLRIKVWMEPDREAIRDRELFFPVPNTTSPGG